MENNQLAVFEKTKAIMRSEEVIQRFAEVLGTERSAKKYIGSVLLAVGQSDKLQECTTQSIMISGMRAATLKLTVDPSLGHGYIVPFKNKGVPTATFIIGYKGLQQLALRTGKYRFINVATVYDGQAVEEDQLRGIHKIVGLPKYDKGKWIPIGYMLYFELRDGFSKTFYMTVEEIEEHAKKYSKTFDKVKKVWWSDSLWKTDFENMAKKTVIRLGLSRYGYFDADDYLTMSENDDSEFEELDDDYIDGELLDSALQQEEERKHEHDGKTTEQLSAMLGFDVDEPQPESLVEAAQELGGVVKAETSHKTYNGKTVKIHTHEYPQAWGKVVTEFVPKKIENTPHLDGILQKLELTFDTPVDDVIASVNDYLKNKQEQK